MENLDAQDVQWLMEFWGAYRRPPRKAAEILFGGKHAGYIRAAKDCANYASNKATAMQCRARGDINIALQYEAICERIYSALPDYARW